MAAFNTYLNFEGTTEAAFNFYRSVLGGEFSTLQRFKDTQHGDHLPEADREKIMHVALPVGNGNVLMGTDTLASMGQSLTIGTNISICISPESLEETHTLFNGISAGGTVITPLEKMFWGAYFGLATDKFGIRWMVNYEDK